jgi:hypothetical protein
MKKVFLFNAAFAVSFIVLSGCGGDEKTEPVPLEPLVLYTAEVIKPSALYETSECDEEDQFYFLEQGDSVEVLQTLYPGGPALIRTADGEEGWCPDIAMKAELMTETFAVEALKARYPDGAFEEVVEGVVGWVVGDKVYFIVAAASGDFTGDGEAETAICEALTHTDDTGIKAYIVKPDTFENIAETETYRPGTKGVAIAWLPLNDNGHTAVSLSEWAEGNVETPLRLKEIETTHLWLYDAEMSEVLRFVSAEDIVTAGAATPDNISKGSFTGRFYWQKRVITETDYNEEGYYAIKAIERINLYCCDGQVFEYEIEGPVVYKYDDGYNNTAGEYFEAKLSGNRTIREPARLRRQPAETGDPIRIIEAGETVEIIISWPDYLETEESEGYWYYVFYRTKGSEEEYAGWILDKYFE